MIGPLNENEAFIGDDFSLLEKFTLTSTAGRVEQKVKPIQMDGDKYAVVEQ